MAARAGPRRRALRPGEGPDGERVYEAHGRTYKVEAVTLRQTLFGELCGDLTGDGVPELVMTESTMGAHCCYTHYVVSLTSPPQRLLMWEKGDARTPILPVKYRPGREWQLQGSVVFWPPFDPEKGDPVLSYATAPVVPVVLALVGGRFERASLSFPEAYRRDREALRARCAAEKSDCEADLFDLFAWVDSLAIGDWETERSRVKNAELRSALVRQSSESAARTSSDRRAGATRRALAKQVGSLPRAAR